MIMAKRKKSKSKIISFQYIHDPEAAKEWMDLVVDLAKQRLIKQSEHKDN